eukprot:7791-Chlamydomonas_euryale.AAC.2
MLCALPLCHTPSYFPHLPPPARLRTRRLWQRLPAGRAVCTRGVAAGARRLGVAAGVAHTKRRHAHHLQLPHAHVCAAGRGVDGGMCGRALHSSGRRRRRRAGLCRQGASFRVATPCGNVAASEAAAAAAFAAPAAPAPAAGPPAAAAARGCTTARCTRPWAVETSHRVRLDGAAGIAGGRLGGPARCCLAGCCKARGAAARRNRGGEGPLTARPDRPSCWD